jgi:hypothetical protein
MPQGRRHHPSVQCLGHRLVQAALISQLLHTEVDGTQGAQQWVAVAPRECIDSQQASRAGDECSSQAGHTFRLNVAAGATVISAAPMHCHQKYASTPVQERSGAVWVAEAGSWQEQGLFSKKQLAGKEQQGEAVSAMAMHLQRP